MSGWQAQRQDLLVQRLPEATMNQSAGLEEHSKILKFNPSNQYTAKCHNKGKVQHILLEEEYILFI